MSTGVAFFFFFQAKPQNHCGVDGYLQTKCAEDDCYLAASSHFQQSVSVRQSEQNLETSPSGLSDRFLLCHLTGRCRHQIADVWSCFIACFMGHFDGRRGLVCPPWFLVSLVESLLCLTHESWEASLDVHDFGDWSNLSCLLPRRDAEPCLDFPLSVHMCVSLERRRRSLNTAAL